MSDPWIWHHSTLRPDKSNRVAGWLAILSIAPDGTETISKLFKAYADDR